MRRVFMAVLASSSGVSGDQQTFEKSCANCHQIANKGGRRQLDPNFDGIGIRGIDRFLEDTLDPNRNVD